MATTSILKLPCNPPTPDTGGSVVPCPVTVHSLFMRSLVPCLLLYLSSVLWLLRRPPQPLPPARAYVRGETDLNTVNTVIVLPQPSLPWRTLEQHLSPPPPPPPSPIEASAGRPDKQSFPVQSCTRHFRPFRSRPGHTREVLTAGTELIGAMVSQLNQDKTVTVKTGPLATP